MCPAYAVCEVRSRETEVKKQLIECRLSERRIEYVNV